MEFGRRRDVNFEFVGEYFGVFCECVEDVAFLCACYCGDDKKKKKKHGQG